MKFNLAAAEFKPKAPEEAGQAHPEGGGEHQGEEDFYEDGVEFFGGDGEEEGYADDDTQTAMEEMQQTFDFITSLLPDTPFERIYEALYDCQFDAMATIDLLMAQQEREEQESTRLEENFHFRAPTNFPPSPSPSTSAPSAITTKDVASLDKMAQGLRINDERDFPTLGAAAASKPPTASQTAVRPDSESYHRDLLRYAASSASEKSTAAASTAPKTAAEAARKKLGVPLSNAPVPQQRRVNYSAATVTTGAAVTQEYAALRAEARDLARARNAYFQQATQAFLAGNKALAKELGNKGRELNDQMFEAHERAAGALYSTRNEKLRNAGAGPKTIDLHGLHVAEAERILENLINSSSFERPFFLIVGVGKHSAVKVARLPAAVESFLTTQGFKWVYEEPGLIKVL